MAAPAYIEANGRAALSERLRPDVGATLEVALVPRPPLTMATLAGATPTAVASVQWIDDNGTGHLEPLQSEVDIPAGTPVAVHRVTLGELVEAAGTPVHLSIMEMGAECVVVGLVAVPVEPPGPLPTDPWSSGVTPAELARAMSVGLPAGGTGPVVDRLELAIRTAEDAIGWRLGRRTVADWPTIPSGARSAVLQVATRVYRASDVTFGVLQTELGTAYTGRWITPEVELGLLGLRRKWGVA